MNNTLQEDFLRAAEKNDVAAVRRLLAAGADVNAPMEWKFCTGESVTTHPVLRFIDSDADMEMLQVFIDAGVNVNQKNASGETLLHRCDMPCLRLVKALIDAGVDVNARDYWGSTPLLEASIRGDEERVLLLIQAGAHINVMSRTGREATPYEIARTEYNLSLDWGAGMCMNHLQEAGALTDLALDIEEFPELSPLNYEFLQAVQYQEPARVQAALDAGADVNATDRYGTSAMKQAVDYDDDELCRILLKSGISTEHIAAALTWAWAPLAHNNLPLINDLLSALSGETLNQAREHVFFTAIRNGSVSGVKEMLRQGVHPNCRNDRQDPALLQAIDAWDNMAEIVELLLDEGADINAVDDDGRNALLLATVRRHADVMRLLLLRGGDYRQQNKYGASAYSRSRDVSEIAKVFDETLAQMRASETL